MKKIIITALILIATLATNAQTWHTDMIEAQEVATEKNRKIILVFQGSDWCAPCMKLEKEIWSSTTFKDYAKGNYVLVKADFPKRKKNKLSKELQKHNDALAEKYNKNGVFPLVVVLDKTGKVIGKTTYKKTTPKEFLEILNSL